MSADWLGLLGMKITSSYISTDLSDAFHKTEVKWK